MLRIKTILSILSPWIYIIKRVMSIRLFICLYVANGRPNGWEGHRQLQNCGVDTHGEREPITGIWGQSPQWGPGAEPLVRGLGGEAPPWSWKPFNLWMPNGSSKFASFSVFCKISNPRYLWYIWQKLKVYRLRWHVRCCVSTEKQFAVFVMCEVALHSKSAQIVAPKPQNVYWETPQPQQLGYTTEYPVSAKHSDSG